jgi:hypothetical protein
VPNSNSSAVGSLREAELAAAIVSTALRRWLFDCRCDFGFFS